MDLYFSIPSRKLVGLNGTDATFQGVRKGGDTVNLRFLDSGGNVVALADPDSDLSIILGVKLSSALYNVGFLTNVTSFTKIVSGADVNYQAFLSYNTDSIDAAFLAPTLESIGVSLQVDYRYGAAIPTKSLRLQGTIFNNIITGDEPEPTSGDPTFAVSFAPTITGLTGGGATNLDGQTGGTSGIPAGKMFFINVTGLGAQAWLLGAGTDAPDGVTVIHPINYNADTYAFVFRRIL